MDKENKIRKIVILGAGGTSQEIVDVIKAINKEKNEWDICGYLDDDPNKQGKEIDGIKVIGTINDFDYGDDIWVVNALGNPNSFFVRKRVVDTLPPVNYATLIHPSTYVSEKCVIDEGTVIFPYCAISPKVNIGKHVLLFPNVTVAHDTKIGDYVTLTSGVKISGNNKIEEGVYVGTNATIVNHVNIKKWSLVGAGSLVAQNIKEYSFVLGNPGRVIKKFDPNRFKL